MFGFGTKISDDDQKIQSRNYSFEFYILWFIQNLE